MVTPFFQFDSYLQRIGMSTPPKADRAGLRELVRAQSFALAFENLDVLARNPIRIDQASIINKLLHGGRGGYCYELNNLLSDALQACGFSVTQRLARVTYRRPEPGPQSHLIMLVECEGEIWLVDAGFGGPGLVEPMPLRAGESMMQNGALFRLQEEENGYLHLQRKVAENWEALYMIAPQPIHPIDMEVANHFVSTWERSPFRSIFMCAIPVENGLIAMRGTEVVHLNAQLDPLKQVSLKDHHHLQKVMATTFGINVDETTAKLAWKAVNGAVSG